MDENVSGEKAYEAQNKGEADAEQHSAEEDGEASNERSFQEDAIRTCYDAEGDIEHVQEMETKEVSAGVYHTPDSPLYGRRCDGVPYAARRQ